MLAGSFLPSFSSRLFDPPCTLFSSARRRSSPWPLLSPPRFATSACSAPSIRATAPTTAGGYYDPATGKEYALKAVLAAPVPNVPSLDNVVLNAQGFVSDVGGPFDMSASQGLEFTLHTR